VATIVAAIFIISGLGSGRSDSSNTDNSGYTSSYQDKETYDGKPSNNKNRITTKVTHKNQSRMIHQNILV